MATTVRERVHEGAESGALSIDGRPSLELVKGAVRPSVAGKFLSLGSEKLYVQGVTYGAFKPDEQGNEYTDPAQIERDFRLMAGYGINTVRIPHTMPPRSLLDIAQHYDLQVMVGLSAEQYVGFLIDRTGAPDIERITRAKVRQCAGHPALLCYGLGNEIPAGLARWLGPRPIERYLRRMYDVVKEEDPEGLVTYVNYPTTEYLELPFLDLVCFNVYLESQNALEAYVDRLQNIAGDRPLILSEVGLDAMRNGERAQALSLDWQIRTAFRGGCAGVFVFSWTDEWHRAGAQVEDWAFGVTDRERRPKPALETLRRVFAEVPLAEVPLPELSWPRISVVVCSYNGSRTIRDTLEGLRRLDYPNYETIVVDDGSTDGLSDIVRQYDVRLIRTENQGLSAARNTGLAAATGEIVAYLDDDAYPDSHWLKYVAAMFADSEFAGVGGPNLPPPGDGLIAECVAAAPGGPVHVLLSDREAEHVPGCNMAFRKACLEAIGGFDTQFRVAGDDVDICWRLQQRGWTLGFHPGALVWHHRRNSVRAYWRQQVGYGKAEGLLKRKWPEKYNHMGQLAWAGRIYSRSLTRPLDMRAGRIYHGPWGGAPFQRLYRPEPTTLHTLTLMPEWYLAVAVLTALTLVGMAWKPLLHATAVPLAMAALLPVVQAWRSTADAIFGSAPLHGARFRRFRLRLLAAALHVLHPIARLWGRMRQPSRRNPSVAAPRWPRPRAQARWVQESDSPEERLRRAEETLRAEGGHVRRGGEWDRWDLEVAGGWFGRARVLLAVEDHGGGNQFVRWRWWPSVPPGTGVLIFALVGVAAAAGMDGAPLVAWILGVAAGGLAVVTLWQCGWANAAIEAALKTGDAA